MDNNKQPVCHNMQVTESAIGRWASSIVSVLAVSVFPVLFLYFQNADEASFSEVMSPLLIFIGSAAVIFVVFLLFSKYAPKAAIITSLFMLVLLNYSLLERGVQIIFPVLRYWHILPIFLYILAHIAWFICKKMQKELANTITLVMCIVFCGLILFNGVTAAPTIIKKISVEKQTKEQKAKATQTVAGDVELPNIYYLLFDEYSSINFMKKYYNYDNSEFIDYLEELGFNISYNSHNESIMTSTVVTNLVNLDYVVDNTMLESEKKNYRINNLLFKLLTKKGYMLRGIGDAEFFGLKSSASEVTGLEANTIGGETIADLLYKKTVIWPFYSVCYTKSQEIIISAFKYLKNPNNFKENGCFTICYVNCPHEPFYFDKNGNVYAKPTSNWKEAKYYLGQYIFATNQILDIVDSIVKNDPNSIIIIQSDHSARASSDNELFMEIFPLEDMSNIFNAVYFKGEKLDIEGLSGVNTLRLLMNKSFAEKFEMLEIPPDTYKYK